ncbi:MAG: ribosome biogenesis GTP-binding protein YihA/YsxC [Deltaproteobacteria bacterium]|jgi:GTP-binding protein|nr:ribosome biogenesis GTP-binding protein YihA/YsxC [Deltaproteobacteria bacterium]
MKEKYPSPPAVSAEFVVSAAFKNQFPAPLSREVALLGRSNCGKSSLLNRLVGRRALAKVGAAPGRTRLINFFKVRWNQIHSPLYLVDLPGYGYAAAPKAMVESWKKLAEDYLTSPRGSLLALILIDIRRGPQKEERELRDLLMALSIPFQVVATKSDKITMGQVKIKLAVLETAMGGLKPPLAFSSISGQGREKLIELAIDFDSVCSQM